MSFVCMISNEKLHKFMDCATFYDFFPDLQIVKNIHQGTYLGIKGNVTFQQEMKLGYGKMLLVMIVTNNKIDAYFRSGQVK